MIKPKIFTFIDSQNLNLGVKSQGWVLDFEKFAIYLKDKFKTEKIFLFIGYVPGNEALYTKLQQFGYICVFKPTLEVKGAVKGNVDAELVLHSMIQIENYDKAIIVSGDGDFHCLMEYLEKVGKLEKIITPNKKYSSLLRKFASYIMPIGIIKAKVELKKGKK